MRVNIYCLVYDATKEKGYLVFTRKGGVLRSWTVFWIFLKSEFLFPDIYLKDLVMLDQLDFSFISLFLKLIPDILIIELEIYTNYF